MFSISFIIFSGIFSICVMLCYVMLRYVTLRYVMLCYVMLSFVLCTIMTMARERTFAYLESSECNFFLIPKQIFKDGFLMEKVSVL